MNHLDWIRDTSIYPDVQERLESNCRSLIDTYFNSNDDYAIEKFLKVYTEGLRYLERYLLKDKEVGIDDIVDTAYSKEEFIQEREEVRKVMLNEVQRQFRHALTFMSTLRVSSPELISERRNFTLLENTIEKTLDAETAQKVYAQYSASRKELERVSEHGNRKSDSH